MRKIFGLSFCIVCVAFFFMQAVSSAGAAPANDYRGFITTKSTHIPDAKCTVVELEHTKSGAQVLHIQNEDPENFFSICFRTHPNKSNGVAHVLEHTVFQGSKKYPINGVYFHMNNRSLATFMNAFTGPDYTCYPAASQCVDDFYNLLSVYTDAAFYPLLNKNSFSQEGHRLEFETFDDPSSPLIYKGIVYNEMKGSLTSPQVRMMRATNSALFPDAAGDVFAGGDPECIPELTHEEFVQFHKEHYYPGNCLFYFYGNLPLEKHLDFLADGVLANVEKKAPIANRPIQERFSEPCYKEIDYPAADLEGDDNAIVGISWLSKDAAKDDQNHLLGLRVLDLILMESDASPLKHELLQSGFCKEADSGVDVGKRQIMLYLEGCRADQAKQLDEFVQTTLKTIAKEGIASDVVERTIARIELEESDLRKGKGPIGLSLLHSCAVAKLQGRPATSGLTLREELNTLRSLVKEHPSYFSYLIKNHLVDNAHRVCLVLKPSSELAIHERESEKQKLQAIKDQLSDSQKEALIQQAADFRRSQVPPSVNEINCLPGITLDSISKEISQFPITQESVGSLDVFYHRTFTNHITYTALEFPVPDLSVVLSEDEVWLVSLYAYLLPKLGAGLRGYKENLNFINDHTGGITADISVRYSANGSQPTFKIGGKALDRKADKLFDLMHDILTTANFSDAARVRQLLIKHANEVQTALKFSAVNFATAASLASQSVENRLADSWAGLEYCQKLLALVQNISTEFDPLLIKLQCLQKKLQPSSKAHLLLACDKLAYESFQKATFYKLSTLPIRSDKPWNYSLYSTPMAVSSVYHLPTTVAFNARGFRTVSCKHSDSAYLLLASELVSSKFLLTRVREEGGAYGAGAKYDPTSGNFSFFSYRDPNIASTNQAFSEAINLLVEGRFTEEDVQKAKIALVQDLDAPLHPAAQASLGYKLICENRSDEERKIFRHKILTASTSDIQRAAFEHLPLGFNQSALLTLASKDLSKQENNKLVTPLIAYELQVPHSGKNNTVEQL